jgi:hypothetical protein
MEESLGSGKEPNWVVEQLVVAEIRIAKRSIVELN